MVLVRSIDNNFSVASDGKLEFKRNFEDANKSHFLNPSFKSEGYFNSKFSLMRRLMRETKGIMRKKLRLIKNALEDSRL